MSLTLKYCVAKFLPDQIAVHAHFLRNVILNSEAIKVAEDSQQQMKFIQWIYTKS